MAHLLEDARRLIINILVATINAITKCIKIAQRTPKSPTLSAQEGELDNLLQEPSGGWDDQPSSRGYNRAREMVMEPTNSTDDRIKSDVQPQATWTEGKTMEELWREEAELARFDPPGPPRDVEEFGDFNQATLNDRGRLNSP